MINFHCSLYRGPGTTLLIMGKSYNGVAILSKTPLGDVRASLCDEVEDEQARVIAATVASVRVYSIYAPNGQSVGSPAYEYKIRWYARLRDCLARERNEKVVVAGRP